MRGSFGALLQALQSTPCSLDSETGRARVGRGSTPPAKLFFPQSATLPRVKLFGRGKVESESSLGAQVLDLGTRIAALESEVRMLRAELALTSDLVAKRMRRAVAAERAAERNQERAPDEGSAPAVTPARRLNMWGARARIAARRGAPRPVPAVQSNGSGAAPEELPEVEE